MFDRYAALSMPCGIHSNIAQLIVDLRGDTQYGFNDYSRKDVLHIQQYFRTVTDVVDRRHAGH